MPDRKWSESEIDIVLLDDHAWTNVVIETTLAWSSKPAWEERPPPPLPTFYSHWLPQVQNSEMEASTATGSTGAELGTKSCSGSQATQGAVGRD